MTALNNGVGGFGNSVRDVFAQVTRYPVEILELHARLEEELGIDSVKLGEVFSVLRERYHLPEKINLPRERLTTIADIAEALANFVEAAPALAMAPMRAEPSHLNGGGNGNGQHAGVAAASELESTVLEVFAAVTRYPPEILDLHAQLEGELGIDSVKLGEVFSVLRERFRLPARPDIPRENLKTIAGIVAALSRFVANGEGNAATNGKADAALAPNGDASPRSNGKANGHAAPTPAARPELEATVLDVFAQVTRYPREILEPDARFEEDLGIDSVKLGEVFSVLREKYSLPAKLDIPREELKSIAGVTNALSRLLVPAQPMHDAAITPPLVPSAEPQIRAPRPPARSGNGHLVEESFAGLVPHLKPFDGKVALITGSGRGLGKDIACYLAELGAAVVVNSFHSRQQGIDTVAEITAAGGAAIHAWGSVANPEHLSAIFAQVESAYGGLDFFISNASNGMLARLQDITAEHWQKAFHTNVIGLHQSALKAAALMRRRGGGKIITMSSPASHGYVDYFGCMGAVKAAVESLTKSLAIELSVDNIQVNCVSPGPIYGDLIERWPESERLIAKWEAATVYERLCEARDVSHFVAYLLSDAVKLFAGSVLVMDGGISVRWG